MDLNNFLFGHIPTRTSAKFMSQLLSDENKYKRGEEVSVDLGKPWQVKEYINVDSGNFFWGEPMINTSRESIYTFTYKDTVDWGISFHFKGRRYKTRGVKEAGKSYGTTINMDRLYYILVNRLNGGDDFVAEFLQQSAPYLLADELRETIDPVIENIVRSERTGKIDRRYRAARQLAHSTLPGWKEASENLEKRLKEEFVSSMKNGEITLRHTNSQKTRDLKQKLFGSEMEEFVASEQFINAIVFTLNMRLNND